jgi:hypothetical protein
MDVLKQVCQALRVKTSPNPNRRAGYEYGALIRTPLAKHPTALAPFISSQRNPSTVGMARHDDR